MASLNQSFGIQVIKLNANPYQRKILFPAVYRDLAFKTIGKHCKTKHEFNKFIEQTEKLMPANEKYVSRATMDISEHTAPLKNWLVPKIGAC
jgi:hypothetical protein